MSTLYSHFTTEAGESPVRYQRGRASKQRVKGNQRGKGIVDPG